MNKEDELKKEYVDKKEILTNVVLFLITATILIAVFITILSNHARNYESQCKGFGGDYYELQNVTCELLSPECFRMCKLNGITYNYYDTELCVADCNYYNSLHNDTRCVC